MDEAARPSQQITHWLTGWRGGDVQAGERLFEVLHPELRRIAGRFMARERRDHTLDPGALVNEGASGCSAASRPPSTIASTSWPLPHRPCDGC
jgi:hypothetical protein